MIHSRKQILVFLHAVNQTIENPHLALYIRQLKKGQDIQTKQYLRNVPPIGGNRQDAYEMLWTYCISLDLKNKYLTNTLETITFNVDKDSWEDLKDRLDSKLKLLGLPEIE